MKLTYPQRRALDRLLDEEERAAADGRSARFTKPSRSVQTIETLARLGLVEIGRLYDHSLDLGARLTDAGRSTAREIRATAEAKRWR